MRFAALIVAALLATGCAAPAARQADGLVDAFPVGERRVDGFRLHVHPDQAATHRAARERYPDDPALIINEFLGIQAHAWTSPDGSEIHVPAPALDIDPVWLCVLGHEMAHASAGRWHPPGVDISESCSSLKR